MNHPRIKLIPLLLIFVLLVAGCQELSVNVEPVNGTPTAGTAATTAATAGSEGQATPAATAPVQATQPPKATPQPGHLPPGSAVRLAAIHMVDLNQGWAIGNRGLGLQDAILRTSDGAQTWQDVTPPLPAANAGSGRQALGAFRDAQHAWVIYYEQTPSPDVQSSVVWITADGGATWQTSQPLDMQGVNIEVFTPGFFDFLDAEHGWLLAHVGAGMNHDYVVLFTSADGGQTWARVVDPEKNNLQMSCEKTGLVFQTAQIGYVTGDCHGVMAGIFFSRSMDGGATWQDVALEPPQGISNPFADPNQVCGVEPILFPSAQDAFVPVRCSPAGDPAAAQRWLYASQNGGQTFHALPLPAQYGSFDFLDPQVGWLVGSFIPSATRFTLYQTVDGGNTWRPLANLGWTGQPDFVDSQNGWVVAQSGEVSALVHTEDGGASWQEIKPRIAE